MNDDSKKTMKGKGRGKGITKKSKKTVRKSEQAKAKPGRLRVRNRIEDTDSDEESAPQSNIVDETIEEEVKDVQEPDQINNHETASEVKVKLEENDEPHPSSTISSPTPFKNDQEIDLPPTLAFVRAVKNNIPLHNNQPLSWNHKVNLIGIKCPNPRIHLCGKCGNPILIYGRLLPCKHIFCFDCAKMVSPYCPKCNDKVLRVEKNRIGCVYVCIYEACQRTYLSQRDLEAHIAHRHLRRSQLSHNTTDSPNTSTNSAFNFGSNITSPSGMSAAISLLSAQYSHRIKQQLASVPGNNFSASSISSTRSTTSTVPMNEELLAAELNQIHANQLKLPKVNKNILSPSLMTQGGSKRSDLAGWSNITTNSLYQSSPSLPTSKSQVLASPIYDKSSLNSITQRTSSSQSWNLTMRSDSLNQHFHSHS